MAESDFDALKPITDPIVDAKQRARQDLFGSSQPEAAWGSTIPLSFGRRMVKGKPIWLGDRITRPTSQVTDAGTPINETVIDFAVSFGYSLVPADERLRTDVVRLWLGNKLIYQAGQQITDYNGMTLAFHPGLPTEQPDSTILAKEGADRTPAFRDLIYVVVKGFKTLENIGNGLPEVRAELSDVVSVETDYDEFQVIQSERLVAGEGATVDWRAQSLYGWTNTEPITGEPSLHEFSIPDMDELRRTPIVGYSYARINTGWCSLLDTENDIIITTESATISNTVPVIAIRTDSARVIGSFGVESNATTASETTVPFSTRGDFVKTRAGGVDYYGVVLQGFFGNTSLLAYNHSAYDVGGNAGIQTRGGKVQGTDFDFEWVWHYNHASDGTGVAVFNYAPAVLDNISAQDSFLFYAHAGTIYQTRISMGVAGAMVATELGQVALLPGSIIDMIRDPADGNLLIFLNVSGGSALVKYKINVANEPSGKVATLGAQLYFKSIPAYADSVETIQNLRGSRFGNGSFAYPTTGNAMALIDTLTGSYQSIAVPSGLANLTTNSFWDAMSGYVYTTDNEVSDVWPIRIRLAAAAGEFVPLATAVRWLAENAGYDPDEIDTDDLDELVRGGLIERQTQVWSLMGDLSKVFGFYFYESDGVIKFVTVRQDGEDPIAYEIPLDETAPVNSGDEKSSIMTTIAAPDELASDVQVKYIDYDLDYTPNFQTFRRGRFPFNTTASTAMNTYDVPIVMGGTEALTRATRIAWGLQGSGVAQSFRLPWKYARSEPSDILQMNVNSFTYNVRITEVTFNGDWTLSVTGIESGYRADVDPEADEPLGLQTVRTDGPSTSLPLGIETNLLNAADEPASPVPVVYVGVKSYGQTWWRAAFVGVREGGTGVWRTLWRSEEAVPTGSCSLLPAVTNPHRVHEDSVDVVCRTIDPGSLNTVDYYSLLEGVNAALIGQPGRWEVVYFRTVEVLSAKRVRLSGLLRGRRGTDVHVNSHENGDQFILLSYSSAAGTIRTDLRAFQMTADTLDASLSVRAVGDAVSTAPPETALTPDGIYAMPWAPGPVFATLDGSDIDLTWCRRTRLSGPWENGSGVVPLDEESEEYDVEILDPDDGSVLRTFTALTSPEVTYTAAQQTTDGFSPPVANVRLKVYQVSEYVGRGHAVDRVVDVGA